MNEGAVENCNVLPVIFDISLKIKRQVQYETLNFKISRIEEVR